MTWGQGTKAPSFSSHWVWCCRKHFHVLWPGEVWERSSPSEFQAPLLEVSSNLMADLLPHCHEVTLAMMSPWPCVLNHRLIIKGQGKICGKECGASMPFLGTPLPQHLHMSTNPEAPVVFIYTYVIFHKIFEYYIICNLKIKNLSCWGESWSLTAERGLRVLSNLISSRLSFTVWLSAWDSRENGHLWLTGH